MLSPRHLNAHTAWLHGAWLLSLPEVCDQRSPRVALQTNSGKAEPKKIKGIRRALLPVTYILPSARGGPAADGSCSAGGDTGLTARPACRRGRAAARHPRNSVRGPSQPPPPPHGSRPSGTSPYLARVAAESFSGEGPDGLHSLSAEITGSGKEGRKEGGREGGGHPGKSPSATGQRGCH